MDLRATDMSHMTITAVQDWLRAPLRQLATFPDDVHISSVRFIDVDEATLAETDVLYTLDVPPITVPIRRLQLVQLMSSGSDQLGKNAVPRSVAVASSRGANAVTVAEYVIGSILSWQRRVLEMSAWQRCRIWPTEPHRMTEFASRRDLVGATIAILGYGAIGRRVARVASVLGMDINAVNRDGRRKCIDVPFGGDGDLECALPREVFSLSDAAKAAQDADFVCVTLPLNAFTKNAIGSEFFSRLRQRPFLVDVSRGGVVNHGALVDALVAERVAGAAVDVYPVEPVPSESAIWSAPNVNMSPHVASHSDLYARRSAEILARNVMRLSSSLPLINRVWSPASGIGHAEDDLSS